MIARQQQMIAVVDGEIGGGVEIGTTAAPGILRRLVDLHVEAGIAEPHGCGKAGDSGADDVNGFGHQMIAYRNRMASLVSLVTRTGSRGTAKPRASSKSRIAR